jgi:hypothetical protein
MAYVTTEERVDRLEALFGQFMTEMAVLNRKADERNKAAEERSKGSDERLDAFRAEMAVLNQKADERNQAAEERSKGSDERLDAFRAEMAVLNQKADERNQAAEDRMTRFEAEMRASKRDMDKKWGDLANKLGTILEDIVAPNLRRLAIEHFQFPEIEDFMIRRTRRHAGKETEFDAIVVGPAAVILGEAKSKPSLQCADDFALKAATFFDHFPEYHGRRLIRVLGSWAIPEPVIARLTALRIYALGMGEETMELVNAGALEGAPQAPRSPAPAG